MRQLRQVYGRALDRAAGGYATDGGQGLVEYALILAFVSILCIAALTVLKGSLVAMLNNIAANL